MSSARINAMVLGSTGSGKTSLINMYSQQQGEVGHGLRSQTTTTEFFSCQVGGVTCSVADTPGMGDSEGRDQTFLNDMMSAAQRHCSGMHQVLLTIPVDEARFNENHTTAIEMFIALFNGPTNLPVGTVTLVLTQANGDEEATWGSGERKETRRREWSERVSKLAGFPVAVIYHGVDNSRELEVLLASLDSTVYIQTRFMQSVKTLQTLQEEAKRAAEEAERRRAALAAESERQRQAAAAAQAEAKRAAAAAQAARLKQQQDEARAYAARVERDRVAAAAKAAEEARQAAAKRLAAAQQPGARLCPRCGNLLAVHHAGTLSLHCDTAWGNDGIKATCSQCSVATYI